MTKLEYLNLSHQNITNIPISGYNLEFIKKLNLSFNNISNDNLSNLQLYNKLQSLYLNNNH